MSWGRLLNRKVLLFAPDTTIRIPDGVLALSANSDATVEYTVRVDALTANVDIWGTDDGRNYMRIRASSTDLRVFRNNSGGNLTSINIATEIAYEVEENVNPPGTITVTVINGGTQSESRSVGSGGSTFGSWRIGGRDGGNPFEGYIANFRILDSIGTVLHDYPIDDNVPDGGEITDIVGGAHGTLTLGAGQWIDGGGDPVIAADKATQSQVLDNVTLTPDTPGAVVSPESTAQPQSIDATTISAVYAIVPDEVSQPQSIDQVLLSVAGSIAAEGTAQDQAIADAAFTVHHILSANESTQDQRLDVASLGEVFTLDCDDTAQAQNIESPFLTLEALSAQPSFQGQVIDAVSLTQHHVLLMDDATQAQIIDIARFGGVVIGELDGDIVVYALLDGRLVAYSTLDGTIGVH